uniref:Uncharacterized protein n=1 Tax=Meloidogyne enterolobii TaxID=390850 RepID=A0A6V7TL65_MELEN|nr:unnamed protein product [Meloidogyne enterolobii]
MEKITSLPSLFPNNQTTKTNPSQLVVDQESLDRLSTQLKILKIDDFTINKILKKYKPIKKEVKIEPMDCQVFNPQQQPFEGYDGLFEFAISQVIDCGYGHVLPSNFFGTNKSNSQAGNLIKRKMSGRNNNNNIDKIMMKKLDLLNKVYSKRGLEVVSQEERQQLLNICWDSDNNTRALHIPVPTLSSGGVDSNKSNNGHGMNSLGSSSNLSVLDGRVGTKLSTKTLIRLSSNGNKENEFGGANGKRVQKLIFENIQDKFVNPSQIDGMLIKSRWDFSLLVDKMLTERRKSRVVKVKKLFSLSVYSKIKKTFLIQARAQTSLGLLQPPLSNRSNSKPSCK